MVYLVEIFYKAAFLSVKIYEVTQFTQVLPYSGKFWRGKNGEFGNLLQIHQSFILKGYGLSLNLPKFSLPSAL